MPRCKNTKEICYYTGKENTPRGKGYCAKYEKEGKEMRGKDGKMYHVVGDRWVRISSKTDTSPRLKFFGKGDKQGNIDHILAMEREKYGTHDLSRLDEILELWPTATDEQIRNLFNTDSRYFTEWKIGVRVATRMGNANAPEEVYNMVIVQRPEDPDDWYVE